MATPTEQQTLNSKQRRGHEGREGYLGVQQCFGVVYHELTTLRHVYFARAAPVLKVLA